MLNTTRNETRLSRDTYLRARKVFPGGSTRTSVYEAPFPIYLASGSGAYVTDLDGNRFLDFQNNFTALIHGHGRDEIVMAVTAQLSRGVSYSSPTLAEIELAELLCERVSHFERLRFTNTGSEAVMGAIKAARALTGRRKIAKCEGAYHGSYDPVEVSFDPTPANWGSNRPTGVPLQRGTPQSVLDDVVVIPFNDIETTRQILSEEAEGLAAVIVDPMPARLGLIPATSGYLQLIRDFTRSRGIILISDEVLTFRLGYSGASGLFDFEPDLCAFGKIIGGGLPIGAIAGRADVMAVFDPSVGKPLVYLSGTFTANPMSMVAGIAAMRLMTREAFDQLNALGHYARQGVKRLLDQLGVPGEVTGAGSLFRIHLRKGPLHNYRDSYAPPAERAQLARLVQRGRDHGVLLSGTGLGALSTPMTRSDIDRMIAAYSKALSEAVPAA